MLYASSWTWMQCQCVSLLVFRVGTFMACLLYHNEHRFRKSKARRKLCSMGSGAGPALLEELTTYWAKGLKCPRRTS